MSHRNAPFTAEGRRRLVLRCRVRPIAHVAAEAGVSRQCLSKWCRRWEQSGEEGLQDRSSRPASSPRATPPEVVEKILRMRRRKWSARRISVELAAEGITIAVCTVTRILRRNGLNRLSHLDVDGEPLRAPGVITARYPGHMVHLDIKKVGRIPDGGGWRVHGKGTPAGDASTRVNTPTGKRIRLGYDYLHSAIDGFARLAYTEVLPDQSAQTAIAFWHRARAWFVAHGITRITRVVTDNGSCYRAHRFTTAVEAFASRHQRTRPYTPRHNGKVERYQSTLARELLYARPFTSNAERTAAIAVWNIHYNYHRPHSAIGDQPPATKLHTRVTNVTPNYS